MHFMSSELISRLHIKRTTQFAVAETNHSALRSDGHPIISDRFCANHNFHG